MDIIQGKEILIVDDDPDLLKLMEYVLSQVGAHVSSASDGEEALHQIRAHPPDLVILDIMMPGLSGLDVCSLILEQMDVPIIFLTALGKESDIVAGLEKGAVDYVTKPFSNTVLIARIRAALRQAALGAAAVAPAAYGNGHLTIDPESHEVFAGGERVVLTITEYRLLAYLFQHAGQALTFGQILENVWGSAYQDSANYVHVYVHRLRKKLERDPTQPEYLLSEHGVGYRFIAPDAG
jgi:DNA-binding response OmpR family regulator